MNIKLQRIKVGEVNKFCYDKTRKLQQTTCKEQANTSKQRVVVKLREQNYKISLGE